MRRSDSVKVREIAPYKHKVLMKKIKYWESKGYEYDGPINMTREQALTRAGWLRSKGIKARVLKGHFSLYTVMRTPVVYKKGRK
jgi:hypothetical protein